MFLSHCQRPRSEEITAGCTSIIFSRKIAATDCIHRVKFSRECAAPKQYSLFSHLEKSFFSSPLYDFYISCELKNRKNWEQSSFCSWSWSFHVMQVAILADNDAGLYYGRALISFCPTTIFSSGNSHFPTAEWFSRILSFSHHFNRMGISYSFFSFLSSFFLLRCYRFCLFVPMLKQKEFQMFIRIQTTTLKSIDNYKFQILWKHH